MHSAEFAVANGIDHEPALHGRRHWLEIHLQDNGPGISREHLDRIFEPYVTSKTRGTGLGLAIVKKIIEEHGGTIQVDAQTATGAGFRIRLPVIPAA